MNKGVHIIMSKNLIPEICKKLDLEIGEEFKLDEAGSGVFTYMFEDERLVYYFDYDKSHEIKPVHPYTFTMLISGYYKVVKLPWMPKIGEWYYTFIRNTGRGCAGSDKLDFTWLQWGNSVAEVALLEMGWVYRTMEEVLAALPIVAKELGFKKK